MILPLTFDDKYRYIGSNGCFGLAAIVGGHIDYQAVIVMENYSTILTAPTLFDRPVRFPYMSDSVHGFGQICKCFNLPPAAATILYGGLPRHITISVVAKDGITTIDTSKAISYSVITDKKDIIENVTQLVLDRHGTPL